MNISRQYIEEIQAVYEQTPRHLKFLKLSLEVCFLLDDKSQYWEG